MHPIQGEESDMANWQLGRIHVLKVTRPSSPEQNKLTSIYVSPMKDQLLFSLTGV